MKQFVAVLASDDKKHNNYLVLDGKRVFSSYEEVESLLLKKKEITGAVIYSREVSDWKIEGELIK